MHQQFAETKQQANYFEFVHFKPGFHSLYWPRKNTCSLANKKNGLFFQYVRYAVKK